MYNKHYHYARIVKTVHAGEGQGVNVLPRNLEMLASYAVPMQNALNFSLVPLTFALNAPKFSLKRRKLQLFHFFAVDARQIGDFSSRFALNASDAS